MRERERERREGGEGYGTGTGGPPRAPPSCCGPAGSLLPAAAAASASSSLPFSPPVIHLPLLGKAAGWGKARRAAAAVAGEG